MAASSMFETGQTFTAFSGNDLYAFMQADWLTKADGDTPPMRMMGELAGITVQVSREKAPIYTAGSPDPRCFTKGKRGVSGSLMFQNFDRDAFMRIIGDKFAKPLGSEQGFKTYRDQRTFDVAKVSDLDPPVIKNNNSQLLFTDQGNLTISPPHGVYNSVMSNAYDQAASLAEVIGQHRYLLYADQLPPFHVICMFVNEDGHAAYAAVLGCEIVTQGQEFSLDRLDQGQVCAYVARGFIPLTPVKTGNYQDYLGGSGGFITANAGEST